MDTAELGREWRAWGSSCKWSRSHPPGCLAQLLPSRNALLCTAAPGLSCAPWAKPAALGPCDHCGFNRCRQGNTKAVFGLTFCTAVCSSIEMSSLLLFKTGLELLENTQCMLLARLSLKYILTCFIKVDQSEKDSCRSSVQSLQKLKY